MSGDVSDAVDAAWWPCDDQGVGNDRLREAFEAENLTYEQVAAALNVDRKTVQRWVTEGRTPYPKHRRGVVALVGVPETELWPDALARLEPTQPLAKLGLEYDPSIPDTLDVVDKLGHADMERRAFLRSAIFAVGASAAPSRDWLLATIEEASTPTRRVSSDQVDAIRRTFGIFQELDVTRGGGHARQRLVDYMTTTVTPLLRSNDPTTDTGRALYEAGAEQLYLVGWMAFDDGEHSLAQRYLIQALRLAHEVASPELGAHVLAGLSDQANLTGHPDHALQLARAGRVGLQRGHSPACLADLWALQARAEAVLGDARAAAHSVNESERAAENIDPAEEAEWARFIPGAYLNGEYGHAFRDLGLPDETARFATLSAEGAQQQQRARRGALAQATLARAALERHDLDAAAAAGSEAVRLAATVQSSRCVDAVGDLRGRLHGHENSPLVAEFFELADALVPT